MASASRFVCQVAALYQGEIANLVPQIQPLVTMLVTGLANSPETLLNADLSALADIAQDASVTDILAIIMNLQQSVVQKPFLMSQVNEVEQAVSGKTTTTAEATTTGDGLGGTVPEEAEGLNLTLAVRGFTHTYAAFATTMSDLVNERRVSAQYAEYLKECSHELMWDYLRRRLVPCIPAPCGSTHGVEVQKKIAELVRHLHSLWGM